MSTARHSPRPIWRHVALFLLTCGTTFLAGWLAHDGGIASGLWFSGTLMTILLCHEMGHYVVARRHGIAASLPYFIPLPPVISLGTMGAVISMDQPISDRNQLIDVGAAGPIAGLVVAIPAVIVGLHLSSVGPIAPGGVIEGNSILYIGLKYLVTGMILPSNDGMDVALHPMAFAAWVGILITMINLIPVGQLDGGHIACGYLGSRHESFSLWLHRGLLLIGTSVAAFMAVTALRAGRSPMASLEYGALAAMPWLAWAALLLIMRRMGGGRYHPPISETPLLQSRKLLVGLMVVVFLLILTPVPLREPLP